MRQQGENLGKGAVEPDQEWHLAKALFQGSR
ncbi:hypothetical protein SYN63AY4M2_06005 [Synechococcus sp. 63AY4M2]|nr:hypothetical protein SYN63AY4M2_06005 [Synechococcus sp. 63AY4M2]PIK93129.1 hypothetical protein SYN65AY6LI_03410 [Synechococcus sp. 65AY6Li]PIK96434.1 hypothetical protein SYN60AY4M2_06605 [Synechococcus sp. 60AY4M2]PIK99031.1 hypothetical protein SYN63AY4M1_04005 [Synechococcus sp. 63AY4M1]PIL02520.1 hypothetical protein SYN65AY640_10045 [Synechococcus sp. 65AY640]